jgi:hypothetical protein
MMAKSKEQRNGDARIRNRKRYARPGIKELYKMKQRERRSDRKALRDRMKECGCLICGEKEKCCLDFHHAGSEKKDTVSNLASAWGSLESYRAEMEKCIVLCSNCHRKVHVGLIACMVPQRKGEAEQAEFSYREAKP